MGFRQIFGGCRPPKYLTGGVPSNIWGLYTPKIFDGWGSVKYLGGLHPQNILRIGFRQIFGGCSPPKYLTDGVPSDIWRVYTPKIFDAWGSVEYLWAVDPQNISRTGFRQIHLWGLQPQNISRMGFRQIFGGSTPPKYFTDGVPSNISGVYTPKTFHGWGSVKYLGAVHPQNISRIHPENISRMGFCQIFGGSTPAQYFTDGVPSNIWGLYTPKIFHGWGSVKYLGAVHPQNI